MTVPNRSGSTGTSTMAASRICACACRSAGVPSLAVRSTSLTSAARPPCRTNWTRPGGACLPTPCSTPLVMRAPLLCWLPPSSSDSPSLLRDVEPADGFGEAQVGIHAGHDDARIDRQDLDADQRHPDVGVNDQPLVQDGLCCPSRGPL